MATSRQYGVLGPLLSGAETRAFMGVEVIDGEPKPDRPVVVVWLPDDVTSDPARVAKLQRETAFVTQLKHPNIIRVYGLECFEEGWARVVAFVDAEPLHQILLKAREAGAELDVRMAARIVVDVCEGVHFAHEEGQSRYAGRPIVHGGVRPDTLLLTFQGVTMVTGYGASVMAPTMHGVPIRSKFVYFAPEQIIGGKATASPSTDVYAIGATLYELLTGSPPFAGAEDLERAVLTAEPQAIDAPGIAGRLGQIALNALAKRGAQRFETVDQMKFEILRAVADEGEALATHQEISAFVNQLIPHTAPEREGRRSLLDSARDPDMITVLSRPAMAPEGVDQALFEASRPAAVSTLVNVMAFDPNDPNYAREEPTMVNQRAVIFRDPIPRGDTLLDQPAGMPSEDKAEERTIAEALPAFVAPSSAPPVSSSAWAAEVPSTVIPQPLPSQPPVSIPPPVSTPPPASVPPQVSAPPPAPVRAPIQVQVPLVPVPSRPPNGGGPLPFVPQSPTVHQPLPKVFLPPAPQPQVQAQPIPVQPTPVQTLPVPTHAPRPQTVQPQLPPPMAQPQQMAQAALLQNMPVKNVPLPAPKPLNVTPNAPMREESSITAFNARAGDSSRAFLYMVLAAAAGLLIFIFAFPKEPPAGIDAPATNVKLPEEMVREALTRAPPPEEVEPDPQGEAAPPPETKAPEDQPRATDLMQPKFGQLTIESEPEVDVYNGNTHLGRTPVTVKLEVGTHKLRFTDAKTGINKYRTYRVDPEQDRKSKVEFGKSKLTVHAPDGATISLNSKVVGQAPLDAITIYEGRYLLRVSLDGMNWSEWFNAPPGQNIEYKVKLNQ